ncbi:MAG: hypothetical protein IJP61_05315 [Treponema sp.]|nr:hypothetical protein [Treponema sp.]
MNNKTPTRKRATAQDTQKILIDLLNIPKLPPGINQTGSETTPSEPVY